MGLAGGDIVQAWRGRCAGRMLFRGSDARDRSASRGYPVLTGRWGEPDEGGDDGGTDRAWEAGRGNRV